MRIFESLLCSNNSLKKKFFCPLKIFFIKDNPSGEKLTSFNSNKNIRLKDRTNFLRPKKFYYRFFKIPDFIFFSSLHLLIKKFFSNSSGFPGLQNSIFKKKGNFRILKKHSGNIIKKS